MADETTDISTTKCLAILVRYVDVKMAQVCDKLLALQEVNDCTATGIASVLTKTLEEK